MRYYFDTRNDGLRNILKSMYRVLYTIILTFIMLSLVILPVHAEDKYDNPETAIGFFTAATSVSYFGEIGTYTQSGGNSGTIRNAKYSNTSIDSSKYVLFSNAVNVNGAYYDLVLYPFQVGSKNVGITYNLGRLGNVPGLSLSSGGRLGCKLVITKHGNINNPVSMNVIIGSSDLDKDEYISFPTSFSILHQGTKVNKTSDPDTTGYNKYVGISASSDSNKNQKYNTNCIFGKLSVPSSGVIVYYGSTDNRATSFAFDELNESSYIIQFNSNGGFGSIPSLMIKCGDDTSTVMGDIGSSVPTRDGYVFRGWSASSIWSNKRIAYTSNHGGSTAKDGTSAAITSSTWSYATYCTNTGGDASNNTLTLYAQWELFTYTHTLAYDANGGSGAPSNVTETNTQSDYHMTVSDTVPTRTGYTFLGWNTKSDGTGTNYSAGNVISVGADETVTLYARWQIITYDIVYYGNSNTGGSTASQIKTYGVNITLQQNGFTKANYKFTGWNTAANGTGTSYAADAAYSDNADLTLYAQWEPIIIYINYLPNDIDQNVYNETSTTHVYGKINQDKVYPDATWTCKGNTTTPALGDTAYTKTGYQFAGWNIKSDAKIGGSSTSDQNGKKYTGTFIKAGTQLTYAQLISTYGTTLNLYAIWEPIRYKIVYHGNNNWNDETVGTEKTAEYRYDHPQDLESNPFTRNTGETWGSETQVQGYTFIGWGKTAEQHEVDYTDRQNIINLKSTENAVVNLFALWRKDLVLTFDLQGGLYSNSSEPIQLKASVYNSQKTYSFDIVDGQTAANLPKWTEQQGTIDAYGTWDDNGLNTKFFKINEKDQKCRFLGWNTDRNLKTPLINMIVYDTTSQITKYAVEHNETLYAVWEPILIVGVKAGRTLGDLKMADGTLPKSTANNLTAITPVQKVQAIIKPGEQGYYNVVALGNEIYNIKVIFDDAITNIYNGGSTQDYSDTLNLVTSANRNELLDSKQKHSLNRDINTSNILTTRKFYVPQYLGTEKSYPGNIGVQKYYNKFIISQPSYFYKYVKGMDEAITVDFELYLTQSGTAGGGGDGGGGGGGTDPDPTKPTIREFRTTILQ